MLSRSDGGLRATEIEPTLSPHLHINRERAWRCPSDCKGYGSTNVTTMEEMTYLSVENDNYVIYVPSQLLASIVP